MKKIFVLFLLVFFASMSLAMGRAPEPKVKTGDKALDKSLMEIDQQAMTQAGEEEIENELMREFNISQKQMDFLDKRGYSLSEIYYLALLSEQSGKPINDVAALHAKGVGWGILAKKLGVHPSDLNKIRVRLKKARKATLKEMEQERIRSKPSKKSLKGGKGKK